MTQLSTAAQLRRELAWFTIVGAGGFAVDAVLFLLLNGGYDWPITAARAVSASCSIVMTWALNRHLTFTHRKSRGRRAELVRYTLVQAAGLVVNFGIFAAALWLAPPLRSAPIVALALGAAAALVFNFASARTLAFGEPRAR